MKHVDSTPEVLLVCDSSLLAPLLRDLCMAAGCRVTLLPDARAALTHLQSQAVPPTLILVELLLGPASGFHVARRLREHCAAPLWLLSGTDRGSDEGWAPTTGACGVLRYPLQAEVLRNVLAKSGERAHD